MQPLLQMQNPKSVELYVWRTEKHIRLSLKKDGLYIVALRYMRTPLQMQNSKSETQKEAKKKILRIQ